jgi:hypothetical protein
MHGNIWLLAPELLAHGGQGRVAQVQHVLSEVALPGGERYNAVDMTYAL